jgi:hypothetical protein
MREENLTEQSMARELLELLALQGFVLDAPDASEQLSKARDLGQSALSLVETSLMLGRYTSGQLIPEYTTVNFIETVEDACHKSLLLSGAGKVELVSRLGSKNRLAIADRQLLLAGLSQTLTAVSQLVENATKTIFLSSQGGKVYASLRTGENLNLEVKSGHDLTSSSRRGVGQYRLDLSSRLLELANFGLQQTRAPFKPALSRAQLSIVGQVSGQMGLFA